MMKPSPQDRAKLVVAMRAAGGKSAAAAMGPKDGGHGDDAAHAAAEMLLDAISSHDADSLVEAFKNLSEACEASEGDEGDGEEY